MFRSDYHYLPPTVQIPSQWTNTATSPPYSDDSDDPDLTDPPIDIYSCDEFRIYDFKVLRCPRGRSHDWTDCPYAHPGEKASRRDPRRFHYTGTPCPEFKKGNCVKADSCEFAHGVFECWLHPSRYRTQPCKDGTSCKRRVCFFAHTPDQLRVVIPKSASASASASSGMKVVLPPPESYDGSPMRMMKKSSTMSFSPTSILSPSSVSDYFSSCSSSPPVSPDGLAMLMRKMRLCDEAAATTNKSKRGVSSGFDGDHEITGNESFYGLDVGWISELVK